MSNTKSVSRKTPIQLFILSIISLIGLGIAISLTQHFYDVRNGNSGFKSFCNISQTMNCDVVAASSHAEFAFGLPLSSFVAGWFLALFFISLFAYNPFWRREAIRASFGMSFFGLIAAIPTIFVMAVQLKTYCLLCFAVDAVSLFAFILVLSLKPEGFSKQKPDLSKWKVISGVLFVSMLAGVLGLKMMDTGSMAKSDISEAAQSILGTAPVAVKITDDLPSIGPKNAPITIVEFSDFQCPFCRIGAFKLNSVIARYPDKIRVVFRNYPLDQSCNPPVGHTPHPMACEAARVALCANHQGKFESVYQEFFDKQASFVSNQPIEMAKNLGLDEGKLRSCVASPETAYLISRDIEEATLLGIKSTPTFFINGHKMEGAYPVPIWNIIIDKLL